MGRALSLILTLLTVVQRIRPLGLPGLKRRGDAWKIVVFAIALLSITIALRPG